MKQKAKYELNQENTFGVSLKRKLNAKVQPAGLSNNINADDAGVMALALLNIRPGELMSCRVSPVTTETATDFMLEGKTECYPSSEPMRLFEFCI